MKNLIKRLEIQATKDLAKFKRELKGETVESIFNVWYYKNLMTPAKKRKSWKLGELKAYLIERNTLQVNKRLAEQIERVNTISQAKDVEKITISVDWKKSRTWGNNPQAEIIVDYSDNTREVFNSSRVGGCGYDKESTAIAEALNQCNGLLKAFYTQKNRPCNIKRTNGDIFDYGIGGGVLPYFSGGVGVSCYYDNFKSIGFKFETVTHGKTFDVYQVTKKR